MTSNPHFGNFPKADQPKANSSSSKPENSSNKRRSSAAMLPASFIVFGLAISSVVLNVYNIWQHFTHAATQRFLATGLITALKIMFIWPFLKFGFFVATAAAAIFMFRFIRRTRQNRNPVLWGMFGMAVFCAVIGLENTILQFPVILAAFIVITIQYIEIIFWNTRRKSVYLWLLMLIPYGFEFGLQYQMVPIHWHYDTVVSFIEGVFSGQLDWRAFKPVHTLLMLVSVLGIELGERFFNLVERFS